MQSIKNRNLETIADSSRKELVKKADTLFFYEKFRLGCDVDYSDHFKTSLIIDMDSIHNCDLTNYVNKIIKEGPECLKLNLT